MSFRTRPFFIIFLCFLFVISAIWLLEYWIVDPAFRKLENSQALEDSLRVHETLQREISSMGQQLCDWAYWDDMYEYTQNPKEEFIASNLSNWQVLESSVGLNLCYILDRTGEILYSQLFDSTLGGYLSADALSREPGELNQRIQALVKTNLPFEGWMAAGDHLILLAGCPILTTQKTGSIQGMIVFGKICDFPMIDTTRKQTHVSFDLFQKNNSKLTADEQSLFSGLEEGKSVVRKGSDNHQYVYRVLSDLFREPVALLKVPVRADISETGASTSRSIGSLVALIVILLISIGVVVTNRWKRNVDETMDLMATGIAILIFLASLTITYFLHSELKYMNQEAIEEQFRTAAGNRVAAIHNQLQNVLHELDAIRRFFIGSISVDRDEFHRFVSPIQKYLDFESVEWIPKVTQDSRAEFEETTRGEGLPSWRITEHGPQGHMVVAGEREVYYPVCFLEPLAGNEDRIGFDIATDPVQWEAFSHAVGTGLSTATPRIRITEDQPDSSGFHIFVPIYDSTEWNSLSGEHAPVFKGCVGGVFKVSDILHRAVEQASPQGLLTQIFDVTALAEKRLLHEHTPRKGTADSMVDWQLAFSHEERFAGRIWRIEVHPNNHFIAAVGNTGYRLVPYIGLLISVILALYLYSLLSQRRRAERLVKVRTAELQRSEERWQFALEGAGDGVWDWNPQTDEVFFSPQWKAMLGYGEEEISNSSEEFTRLVHPEDRENTLRAIQLYLEGTAPIYSHEFRMQCKDGSYKWILARGKVLSRNPEGQPIRMIGTHTDTTQMRLFEKQLSETWTMLQAAFQQSPIPMVLLSASGIVRIINEAAIRFLGIENEPSPVGQSIHEYQPTWKNFDSQRMPLEFSDLPIFQAFKGTSTSNRELCIQTKSGEFRWNLVSAGPIYDDKGEMLAAFTVFPEMTERKRSEEELFHAKEFLQAIYDQVNHAIFVHDADTGKVINVNRKMCEMYNCTLEEALQLGAEELSLGEEPYSDKEVMAWLEKARTDGPQTFEWLARRKTGELFWVEVNVNHIFIGQDACFLVNVRDISDRKHSEEEKSRLEIQLMQAQKMEAVGLLAGGVAHDLNNLLTPILGYGEMLLCDPRLDNVFIKDIESVVEAGKRARDLVRQLMAFGRRQILQMKPLDLNQVVEAFANLLRRTLREDIQIDLHLAAANPQVSADQGQIEQVLMNLAINGQDAMPGGGRLIIETSHSPLDAAFLESHPQMIPGDYVLLSVGDTGQGMDKETQSRIFEPFFTTKELGKGTGLGLATVYGIIQQHGGHIWVESEAHKGTTFRIYLPSIKPEIIEPAAPAQVEQPPTGNETVLVAEDELIVREITCEMLKGLGYRTLTAETAQDCLSIAMNPEHHIDLLLSDVIMPGMTGKELYQELLVTSPSIKVLFMSGYTASIIADRGIDGDIRFIQKPFTRQALALKVRQALDS